MKRRRLQQPPPYLDGRLADNSVSMQRSMRTSEEDSCSSSFAS